MISVASGSTIDGGCRVSNTGWGSRDDEDDHDEDEHDENHSRAHTEACFQPSVTPWYLLTLPPVAVLLALLPMPNTQKR